MKPSRSRTGSLRRATPWSVVLAVMLAATTSFGQDAEVPSRAAASTSTPPPSTDSALKIETPRPITDAWKRFSELKVWEDGLSEMSYYDATCELYGKKRSFTRVHLFNRQFMNEKMWIKAGDETKAPIPSFKFVIAEEVPTENYNYRFLITGFLVRPGLEPLKVSVSSQEWCGHTYKSLLWTRFDEYPPDRWSLDICSYSYFPGEGDRWWPAPADVDAYETLFVFARAVVAAGGESRSMHLLRSLRSNHGADPHPLDAVLKLDGESKSIRVPAGEFRVRRVVLDWEGPETWFDVETDAPYRLIAFRAGDVEAQLRFVERRAYWDRRWKSGYYPVNRAP